MAGSDGWRTHEQGIVGLTYEGTGGHGLEPGLIGPWNEIRPSRLTLPVAAGELLQATAVVATA